MNFKLAIPLVIVLSLVTGTGTYTFHELVQYLKAKPPGNQTFLDHIYKQHFKVLSIRNLLVGIVSGIVLLGFQPTWYITSALGWSSLFMGNFVGIHMFLCLIVKIVLIYKPETIAEIEDDRFCLWSW